MWLSVCLFACLVVCLFGLVLFCFALCVCLFVCACVGVATQNMPHAMKSGEWHEVRRVSGLAKRAGADHPWKGMVCDRCLAKAGGCVCVCLCVCVCQLLCSKDFTGPNFLRFRYFATIQHARNSQ